MENIIIGSGIMKPAYEEILSIQRKVDIVDIISNYINLTPRGKNFFGVCPFHDDHSPSMSVSKDRQMYRCFVCGASGNVFNFVKDYEKISYYSAVKKVADIVGENFSYNEKDSFISENDQKYYDIYKLSAKFYQNNLNTSLGRNARDYLEKRKINEEIIKKFEIGLSSNDNKLTKLLVDKGFEENYLVENGLSIRNENNFYDIYRNRIMFPLWDLNGNVIAFSGRVYDTNDESKYINTKETELFKKGKLLYNYHNARSYALKSDNIILVEGFMDVIRLYSIGVFNVVATMGTAITKEHSNLIKRLSNNIILMFDGDKAGDKATKSAIEIMKDEGFNIKIVRLEENLDPDDYIIKKGKDKMLFHLSHPKNLINYKMDIEKENLNFNDGKAISKYINNLIKDLENLDDDIEREVEIKKISDITGVDKETIKSKLKNNIKKVDDIVTNTKKEVSKLSKYDKASKMILLYMIRNTDLILYYFNNLSFLPNDIDNKLANHIVLFYKKYNSFDIKDFITYLQDNEELISRLLVIDDISYKYKFTKEEIDSYFRAVREYIKNKKIDDLKLKLKNATNEVLKRDLAKEILDIKIKGE